MRRAPPAHPQATNAPRLTRYSTSSAPLHAPAHPQPSVPVSPLARQVYKRLMWAARDYPGGPDKIRAQAKAAIRKHQHEHDAEKIKELMAKVDYIVNEIDATCNFHKYRHLRRNYTAEEERRFNELKL